MTDHVLVINCGSSSLKFAAIDPISGQAALSGLAERLGSPDASLNVRQGDTRQSVSLAEGGHDAAMLAVLQLLDNSGLSAKLSAVGHRVVHGGERFKSSVCIDDVVEAEIDACARLAPLHNPANLIGIRTARACFANLPQVAVFDTAFHQSMPAHAYLYAIPSALYTEHGLRRYGFHGTSHRYVAAEAAAMLGRPLNDCALITAHLGNGASAAAVLDGHSVDTTMGLTPLEGLVMGTRSGDIDPSLVPFIGKALDLPADQVIDLLNRKSGLLGLSGLSNDCRALQIAAAEGHAGAQIALDVFCYRLAKHIAGLSVALPRLDALVFTGGIGENSVWVREQVMKQLGLLGFAVDSTANARCVGGVAGPIHAAGSRTALVVNTNEELLIARDTFALAQS